MNSYHQHQKLVNDIFVALSANKNIRMWPRHVGFDSVKKIKYGVVGESDIQGIIKPSGRMLCIEVKTGKGVLSKEQTAWRDMIIKFGALYILARSVDDAVIGVATFTNNS